MDRATCYQLKSNAGRATRRRARDFCGLRATRTQAPGTTRICHNGGNRPTRIFLARQSQRFSLHDTACDYVESQPPSSSRMGTSGGAADHYRGYYSGRVSFVLLALSDHDYLKRSGQKPDVRGGSFIQSPCLRADFRIRPRPRSSFLTEVSSKLMICP